MRFDIAFALAAALAALTAVPAAAESRDPRKSAGATGFVTAESRVGNGTVSGPVRTTALGREVGLPSGTWIPCRHSCSETLRVETIDYWQAHGPSAIANESGIFGTLQLRYPRD